MPSSDTLGLISGDVCAKARAALAERPHRRVREAHPGGGELLALADLQPEPADREQVRGGRDAEIEIDGTQEVGELPPIQPPPGTGTREVHPARRATRQDDQPGGVRRSVKHRPDPVAHHQRLPVGIADDGAIHPVGGGENSHRSMVLPSVLR